jgi:hypothetical protein
MQLLKAVSELDLSSYSARALLYQVPPANATALACSALKGGGFSRAAQAQQKRAFRC